MPMDMELQTADKRLDEAGGLHVPGFSQVPGTKERRKHRTWWRRRSVRRMVFASALILLIVVLILVLVFAN